MERLTIEFEGAFMPKEAIEIDECDITAECKDCSEICEKANNNCKECAIQNCFNKLAAYENAADDGLLIHLPCKPGEIVWQIDKKSQKINMKIIRKIEVKIESSGNVTMLIWFTDFSYCLQTHFGKTVFKQKTEAIEALNEYLNRENT